MSVVFQRKLRLVALFAVAASVLLLASAQPAHAYTSIGGGFTCHEENGIPDPTKCVTSSGLTYTVATTTTGYQTVVECNGASTGGLITEVTCSTPLGSRTTAYPGPAGVQLILQDQGDDGDLTLPVCWSVTANFPNLLGGEIEVTESGCDLVRL